MPVAMLLLPECAMHRRFGDILAHVSGRVAQGETGSFDVNDVGPPKGGMLPSRRDDILGDEPIDENVQVAFALPGELLYPEVTDVSIALVTEGGPEPVVGFHDVSRVIGVLCEGEETDHTP